MNEPKSDERGSWVPVGELAKDILETSLPIRRDENEGEAYSEPGYIPGARRTKIEDEIRRLTGQYTSFAYKTDRRLGVGNEVVVRKGTPLRIMRPSPGDYIATDDIKGVLENEKHDHYNEYTKKWEEITELLFEVTVQLPQQARMPSLTQVNIYVPNDKVQLLSKDQPPSGNK